MSFWLDRNVFVTGCTGLLGSWLTWMLCEAEANVVGLVRDSVPDSIFWRDGLSNRITVVRGCVEDLYLVERVLNEYEIVTVFHLAAQTIVPIANRDPLSTFESNVRGTWTLLEACRRVGGVEQIVVASSDKAYGEQSSLPYEESTPLGGVYPYDVSKSCADLIAKSYFQTYALPVCVTRCGNFYGPGDLNWNRIVPGTIRSVLRGERPVIRSDGTPVRDYFYVKDGALAYMLLAGKMADHRELVGEAFNFSNEQPMTVLEITDKILELMGKCRDLRPVVLGESHGEIQRQYLCAEKARTILGWFPRWSLETGLSETIQWYKKLLGDAATGSSGSVGQIAKATELDEP